MQTQYESLPFDVIIYISKLAPHAWYSIVCIDTRISRSKQYDITMVQNLFTTQTVNAKGKTIYTLPNGLRHRNGDQPAVVSSEIQKWYQYGKLHRDGDKPAVIWEQDFTKWTEWYQYGKLHRDGNLPAAISSYDDKIWYQHGVQHRDGDLPAVIHYDSQNWYQYGKLHRDDDKPAVIMNNGINEWWINGNPARESGKFVILLPDGTTTQWEKCEQGIMYVYGNQVYFHQGEYNINTQ
jgi:hypothetical protein